MLLLCLFFFFFFSFLWLYFPQISLAEKVGTYSLFILGGVCAQKSHWMQFDDFIFILFVGSWECEFIFFCVILVTSGDWELLTFKSACASHLYEPKFEYADKVLSNLKENEDTERILFLQMHFQKSMNLHVNLNRARWKTDTFYLILFRKASYIGPNGLFVA